MNLRLSHPDSFVPPQGCRHLPRTRHLNDGLLECRTPLSGMSLAPASSVATGPICPQRIHNPSIPTDGRSEPAAQEPFLRPHATAPQHQHPASGDHEGRCRGAEPVPAGKARVGGSNRANRPRSSILPRSGIRSASNPKSTKEPDRESPPICEGKHASGAP